MNSPERVIHFLMKPWPGNRAFSRRRFEFLFVALPACGSTKPDGSAAMGAFVLLGPCSPYSGTSR
jgi:hypothetical protein